MYERNVLSIHVLLDREDYFGLALKGTENAWLWDLIVTTPDVFRYVHLVFVFFKPSPSLKKLPQKSLDEDLRIQLITFLLKKN